VKCSEIRHYAKPQNVGGQFKERQKTTLDRPSIFERVRQPTNKFNWFMSKWATKNGFRGEYLARYIVSRFAFISESSVGEDYGIDFYCGLSKEIKNENNEDVVVYEKPFLLQIKTKTTEQDKNGYRYIKYDTKDKIKTIYNLESPFFIGFLELKTQKLHIYSTSCMWYANMLYDLSKIDELTFKFKLVNKRESIIEPLKPVEKNGLLTQMVDLGEPIISLNLYNIEKNGGEVDVCRDILSHLIDKEFENIVSKRLGLSYFRWIYEYKTNSLQSIKCGYKFVNKSDDSNFSRTTKDMINAMHPYLVSLGLSAKNEDDEETYKKVVALTRLVDKEFHFTNLYEKNDELYLDNDIDLKYHISEPTTGYTGTYLVNDMTIPFETTNNIKPKKLNTKPKGRKK
jgi:hypothetical protein